jgi:predicted acylesterase/phospholipase RssA
MPIPRNRDCFLTIQGGGLYFLTMLGQAQALIEDHKFQPLGFAGTSAGAILATLLWSGLGPSAIRERVLKLASEPGGLTQLLGEPGEDAMNAPITLQRVAGLSKDFERLGALTGGYIRPIATPRAAINVYRVLRRAYDARGLFPAGPLEAKIDEWIKDGRNLTGVKKSSLPLCFRDIHDAIDEANTTGADGVYLAPLFLTVTNLLTRQLEVIRSFEHDQRDVPIAGAARASGNVPMFFRTRAMPQLPFGGELVDGGVVSNFPAWLYDAFRAEVRDWRKWHHVRALPLTHVGLRIVDPSGAPGSDAQTPSGHLAALVSMVSGRARNQLEQLLVDRQGRTLTLAQPTTTTDAPGFLDFHKVNREVAERMIERGRAWTNTFLRGHEDIGLFNRKPIVEVEVRRLLEELIGRLVAVLNLRPTSGASVKPGDLRAAVYLATTDTLVNAVNTFSPNDPDHALDFDVDGGLTGRVFFWGRPSWGNLDALAQAAASNPGVLAEFGMSPSDQRALAPGRRWMISVPIGDPLERGPLRTVAGSPEAPGVAAGTSPFVVDIEPDGLADNVLASSPRLGVLNIDCSASVWNLNAGSLVPPKDDVILGAAVDTMMRFGRQIAVRLAGNR